MLLPMPCVCPLYQNSERNQSGLWLCPRHGKTGLFIMLAVLREISVAQKVDAEEAWDLAYEFAERRRLEYPDYNFDEKLIEELVVEYLTPLSVDPTVGFLRRKWVAFLLRLAKL